MLVDCPDCTRSYHLSADDLGGRGRVLVCPRCDARWFQQSDKPVDDAGSRQAAPAADVRPDRSFDTASRALPRGSKFPDLRGARALFVLALLAVSTVAAVGKRELIVRTMPRTARIYAAIGLRVNVRGLDFARVVPKPMTADDMTIAGEIRNVAGRRVHIPRVAFVIRDAAGATLMSWSENPPAATLAGGRTIAFQSEPHRLPPEGRTVIVRFEDEAVPIRLAGTQF